MSARIAVSKIGRNALTSTNPNDFVFHTDYNTFKIVAELTLTITLSASTNDQSFSIAHNLDFIPLVRGFAKQDGIDVVFPPNQENASGWQTVLQFALDTGVKFNYITSDEDNISVNFDNTNISSKGVTVKLYCLEDVAIDPADPVPGTRTGNRIVVTKPGYNAITEMSAKNKKFDSQYGTLKYYLKANRIVTLDAVTVPNQQSHLSLSHNLGYYPFLEAFVRVYIGSPANDYEPAPFFGSGIAIPYDARYTITENTVELYTKINGVSTSLWVFEFLLFLYRNDLQL